MVSWEADTIASGNLQTFDNYRIDGVNADSYRTSSAGVFAGAKLVSAQRGAFCKMVPSTVSLAVVCAPVDQGAATTSSALRSGSGRGSPLRSDGPMLDSLRRAAAAEAFAGCRRIEAYVDGDVEWTIAHTDERVLLAL